MRTASVNPVQVGVVALLAACSGEPGVRAAGKEAAAVSSGGELSLAEFVNVMVLSDDLDMKDFCRDHWVRGEDYSTFEVNFDDAASKAGFTSPEMTS